MQTAGARPLGEDEQQNSRTGLSLVEPEDREAVLLQWERKIEQEEQRSRFARDDDEAVDEAGPPSLPGPTAVAASPSTNGSGEAPAPERRRPAQPRPEARARPAADRRTITISGRPDPQPLPRRRQSVALTHIAAQPDRLALWAFLLGLFLLAVAFGTAHA